MIRKKLILALLTPFSILYGLVILLRNGLYQQGILRAATFNLPVIGVGNLTLGGAGKTPHVEYLIRLLSPYIQLGTLSRGYKRRTKGFRIVQRGDSALTVGDEPLQYFLKYPHVKVAVSESRSIGIPTLLSIHPEIQAIMLDDSYQHLSVDPGLNLLLTEYEALYIDDYLLPAGRLREWRSGADRADVVVVTKCPDVLSAEAKENVRHRLNLKASQKLFFSKYVYGRLYHIVSGSRHSLSEFKQIILLTAIANEAYLLSYIEKQVQEVHTMIYEDHHIFNAHEVSILRQQYEHLGTDNTVIVTTEKDATRLILHKEYIKKHNLPIMVLPLKVAFLDNEGNSFDEVIKQFLINFKA